LEGRRGGAGVGAGAVAEVGLALERVVVV